MADIVLSVLVSRLNVGAGLPALQLQNPPGYSVVEIEPGVEVTDKQTSTSPDVRGRIMGARRFSEVNASLRIRITGTSAADLASKTAAVKAAFRQWSYTLTTVINGVSESWTCETYDGWAPDLGGKLNPHLTRRHEREYLITFTRDPI